MRQEKPDHDYAHTMFSECVLNDPANLEYVEAMLDNLQRKYKNNKRGSRLRGFGGRGSFKKAIAGEDWDEVFRAGLELLRTNPWDVATLRALAQACAANHYNEVELRYLKNALDVNRKDVEVNRHCAESLARMGQFDQAIACWHRIEELDKGNDEARRKISELSVAKQRGLPGVETTVPGRNSATKTGGAKPAGEKSDSRARPKAGEETRGTASPSMPQPPDAKSTRSSSRSSSDAKSPPMAAAEKSATGETSGVSGHAQLDDDGLAGEQIAELEQAISANQADLELYEKLGEAYTDTGRYRDAFQVYRRGLEASGGHNLKLRELVEDAQVRMVRAQVAIAEKRAAAENTAESQELVRRFRAELNRQELAVLTSRADRYPQDLSLRYELGIRLKREENFRMAVRAFEAARGDSTLRGLATLEMGECFQHLKQYGNAAKCYQAAETDLDQGSDAYKLALYRGGVLAAALKHLDAALRAFGKLRDLDPDYRDVRARLDKLAQISDKE